MSLFDQFVLKVKRGETPLFRLLKRMAVGLLTFGVPRLPGFLKAPFRVLYELHFGVIVFFRWLVSTFYSQPLFQSRCASVGRNLRVLAMPYVSGHVEIHVGDDVQFNGKVDILCGRFLEKPQLVIKDRASLGAFTLITVNREVIIEEDALISYDCRISDSDGHPRQADLRLRKAPVDPKDIRPVRIGRNAWIGNGSHIMKGVTIGEGAIVGANSVVISDVPPYALAMGNPAEVYFRNYGRAKRASG